MKTKKKVTLPKQRTPDKSTRRMDIDLLNRAAMFSITARAWGGTAVASKDTITSDADRDMIGVTKILISQCQEFNTIWKEVEAIRVWCAKYAMPSFMQKSVYAVALTEVDRYEAKLQQTSDLLRNELVPAFIKVLPQYQEAAKARLRSLYNEKDYPTPDEMRRKFGIEWQWLYFGVPDNLPAEIKAQAAAKLQKKYADAQNEIVAALRAGFAELVNHAVERLTVQPGQKPKVFRGSLLENFNSFFETFPARNLMDDAQLEEVVAKARDVLGNVTPQALRESQTIREVTSNALAEVQKLTDKLVMEKPSRRFDLED